MMTAMKIALGLALGIALLAGQNAGSPSTALGAGTPDAHVAIAKAAASDAYQNLFDFLCTVPTPPGGPPVGASSAPTYPQRDKVVSAHRAAGPRLPFASW
jgi:hypothetical protein